MANKAMQPQNYERATQLIAEATALLALKGQRQKLPDQSLESFLNSGRTNLPRDPRLVELDPPHREDQHLRRPHPHQERGQPCSNAPDSQKPNLGRQSQVRRRSSYGQGEHRSQQPVTIRREDPNRECIFTPHPGATITYVGWLTRTGAKKQTSSLVLEFTTKEHADRAIREGLVLMPAITTCYKCQKYGRIGTQCNANETCGYCAEPHNTRDCRKKEDPNSTPKCALCKEPHAAWSNNCPTRQAEITKVEQTRRIRPSYYIGPDAASKVAQPATRPTLPLFTGGTLRRTLDQRKRPAETLPTERTTAQPRRNPQSATFHNFTQEDSEVFVLNKESLHRTMEAREREMRIENEEYTPNRHSPIMTCSRTASLQPPVDPALIDPALTDLEMAATDE
ncbi:hypothetical protein ACJ73_06836 [Blastomyces percursus]|uniref:CCHC-type domain-containing protein n=1 Tax=Blastomyces percursus TaxID=1658174 RepID=A0A1J9R1A2_9EURO|nr:hypothetical protein ACJ73_06836 [Blastomyces percursus]